MSTLNIFTNFCEYWWLPWLLPLLLWLLGWWWLNQKWRNKYEELEEVARRLRKRIAELEGELELCGKNNSKLKGDLALCEGRYRELELKLREINNLNTGLSTSGKSNISQPKKSKDIDATQFGNSLNAISGSSFSGAGKSSDKYVKVTDDNLQIIEGIGPKMASILKENGVHTFGTLASKSMADLNGILDKYGDKYRIIDPSDWPSQAALASKRDFDGLILHQKADGSESKAEKIFVKLGIIKAFKLNDLKAIEGIGPKIESLLNAAGINTWKALSETPIDKLNSILEAAGARYKLADPTTWPKQAEYASNGEWEALEKYQDFLDGGKAPS